MLQTACVVWGDTVLDLKEDTQVKLQKSFIVPLMSTTAMMRSRGCDIALTEEAGEMINSLLQYQPLILLIKFDTKIIFTQKHMIIKVKKRLRGLVE